MRRGGNVRDGVSTTSSGLLAALAAPDADGLSLDGVLAAESAGVLGVLGGLHLLNHLPQRGTISVFRAISHRFQNGQKSLVSSGSSGVAMLHGGD